MRIVRVLLVLGLLGALLAGCDSGCSCRQEEQPPPPEETQPEPPAEPELEVIRPDTTDVLAEEPEPEPEPAPEPVAQKPELGVQPAPLPEPEPDIPLPLPIRYPDMAEYETPPPLRVPDIQLAHGPHGITFARIPAGKFMFGSDWDEAGRDLDEGPQREMEIPEFWMSRSEVTLRQWKEVMGELPFRWQSVNAPPQWTLDEPVRYVSWKEVHTFLDELSEQTGHAYRLPTEAEWEYACRAWNKSAFWSGANEADVRESDVVGPYGVLHEVESTERFNPFGLFDMHGNVSEWVEDDYVDTYNDHQPDGRALVKEPRLKMKVVRGGNFLSSPDSSRCAAREPVELGTRFSTIGFRIATDRMTEMALRQ